MTPFLHCKKAEILNPGTNGSIRASVSTGAVGGLLVSVPREAELSLRGSVRIRFYDSTLGVVLCRCRLSSPLTSGNMRVYRCKVLEQLARVQVQAQQILTHARAEAEHDREEILRSSQRELRKLAAEATKKLALQSDPFDQFLDLAEEGVKHDEER